MCFEIQSLKSIGLRQDMIGEPPFATVVKIGLIAMMFLARVPIGACLRGQVMLRVQRALSVTSSHHKGLLSELVGEEALVRELNSQGIEKATSIQRKAFDHIVKGHDTLLGAETGSGKTLAYTLPLLARYGLRSPVASKQRGLILAPTAELCKQIENMTRRYYDAVHGQDGRSIALERNALSFADWLQSSHTLQVTITTPKLIADEVRQSDHYAADHPFRALNFVVLDEADMLLDGAYLKDVEVILDKLRLVRRAMIKEGLVSLNQQTVQYVLAAASVPTFGEKSIKNLIKKSFPNLKEVRTEDFHQHHPSIEQEYVELRDEDMFTDKHVAVIADRLRQLANRLPEPAKVSVIKNSQTTSGKEPGESIDWTNHDEYLTMVFMNTADGAKKLAELIRKNGISCTEVHGLLSRDERERNLQSFRDKQAKVLVSTDVCARGIDIPDVRRVVQGEFALNVVQHLHRIGRASRGGRVGAAVNLYFPSSRALVQSVLGAVQVPEDDSSDTKSSIERSFSRRRGFRNKIKKGKLVI